MILLFLDVKVCYPWQVLPISLRKGFGQILLTGVEFLMPNNQTWSVCYQRKHFCFIFKREFATFYGLKEIFILTFEYLGDSTFFVRVFDQSSLEISYLKFCKTSNRCDSLMKSEFKFGFAKGNVIDVTRFRYFKGNVLTNL